MSWNNAGPSTLKKSAHCISEFPPDVEPISFKTCSRYRQNLSQRRGRYLPITVLLGGVPPEGINLMLFLLYVLPFWTFWLICEIRNFSCLELFRINTTVSILYLKVFPIFYAFPTEKCIRKTHYLSDSEPKSSARDDETKLF